MFQHSSLGRLARRSLITLAVATASLAALPASAHKGASGIVKQRMDAMSEAKDASKIIHQMSRAKRPMDFEAAQQLARSLVDDAANMTALFPDTDASRRGAKTEALPAIWQQWDKFSRLAEQMERASRDLLEAAQQSDEDALRAATRALGRSCKACHKKFRKPK